MKKLLNNKGTTLVEVIVAAVIMGIIAVPLLNTLLEITKTNVKSDVELKMNAQMQKAIEEVKAVRTTKISASTDYTAGVWYDRNFKEVTASDASRYYCIKVIPSGTNSISTTTGYDRWDLQVLVTPVNDTTYNISMLKIKNINEYASADGKLYKRTWDALQNLEVSNIGNLKTISGNTFTLDIAGKNASGNYDYKMDSYPGSFTPGAGAYNSTTNKTIAIDVIKNSNGISTTSPLILYVKNNTSDASPGVLNIINNNISYMKLLVNIYNDNAASPTIKINEDANGNKTFEPNVDISRTDDVYEQIKNGDKVTVRVTKKDGTTYKEFTNVIGRDVTY